MLDHDVAGPASIRGCSSSPYSPPSTPAGQAGRKRPRSRPAAFEPKRDLRHPANREFHLGSRLHPNTVTPRKPFMPSYKAFPIDQQGAITGAPTLFERDSDWSAREFAHLIEAAVAGRQVEVWRNTVKVYPPAAPRTV